ncbi:MAG: lipopolysaccharide kinase InaA family protein [Phycisphaerales bacterium]
MEPLLFKNIVNLKSSNGWKGVVVRKWSDITFDPAELITNPERIYKSEKGNITSLKTVKWSNGNIPFVVKKTVPSNGFKKILNVFRTPKSLRNFKLALLLKQKDIEVAEPVAAFWNNQNESIYVTEFIPDSQDLSAIAFGKNPEILSSYSARKAIISQMAQLLAKLFKAGFWHRDPKGNNFIIYKDENTYKAKLIDLDGIKLNILCSREKQIRTLAIFTKTLTRFKNVNLTDLYRGFLIYYQTMRIYGVDSKSLFRKIERTMVAYKLLSILKSSDKFK